MEPEARQLGGITFDVLQLHAGGGFALLLLLSSPDSVLHTSPPTLLQPGEERICLETLLFKKQMFLVARSSHTPLYPP